MSNILVLKAKLASFLEENPKFTLIEPLTEYTHERLGICFRMVLMDGKISVEVLVDEANSELYFKFFDTEGFMDTFSTPFPYTVTSFDENLEIAIRLFIKTSAPSFKPRLTI